MSRPYIKLRDLEEIIGQMEGLSGPITLALTEEECEEVQDLYHIVDGDKRIGKYTSPYGHLEDLFEKIADLIVKPTRPKAMYSLTVPRLVQFFNARIWKRYQIDRSQCASILIPLIDKWEGKYGLMVREQKRQAKESERVEAARIAFTTQSDALTNFRVILGFDPEGITQDQAQRIWAKFEIIDSLKNQAAYSGVEDPYGDLYKAFDAAAEILIGPQTTDTTIENNVLGLVEAYGNHKRWQRINRASCRAVLSNKVTEWKNRRDLMALEPTEEIMGSHLSKSEVFTEVPTEENNIGSKRIEHPVDRRQITFPLRAAWLQGCLTERNWDRNILEAHNGPDHQTTKRILDGEKVQDRSLRKLVTGLNAHPKAKQVRFRDIPTD